MGSAGSFGKKVVHAFVFSVTVSAAAWAVQSQPEMEVLTEADVSQARAFLAAGQFESAIAILTSRPPAPEYVDEALFILGLASVEQALHEMDEERQEHLLAQAVESFHTLLSANPNLTRVRLELGRAFFYQESVLRRKGVLRNLWSNKDDLAKEQFERVLAEDPPQAVQNNINVFLAQIKSRRPLRFWVNASVIRDDNYNNEAADKTIWIKAFGTTLPFRSDSEPPKSGWGVVLSFPVEYRHPVNETLNLLAETQLVRREFPGASSDSTYVELSFGPEYQLSPRSEVTLSAVAGYNHWPNVQSHRLGVRAQTSHTISFRSLLQTNLGVYRQTYHPSPENSDSDAKEYEASVNLRHRLSPTFTFDGEIRYSTSRLEAKPDNDSRTLGGSVGLSKDFRNGLTAGLSVSVSRTNYKGIVGAPTIDDQSRTDRSKTYQATLLHRDFTVFGFSPQLIASHNTRDSNSQAVNFQSNSATIGFVRQF